MSAPTPKPRKLRPVRKPADFAGGADLVDAQPSHYLVRHYPDWTSVWVWRRGHLEERIKCTSRGEAMRIVQDLTRQGLVGRVEYLDA